MRLIVVNHLAMSPRLAGADWGPFLIVKNGGQGNATGQCVPGFQHA